jgi:hypothetical protein
VGHEIRPSIYLLVAAILAAAAAVTSPALRPESVSGWVAVAAFLFVLSLLGEWAWEGVLTQRLGHTISKSGFSFARIGIALALVLPLFAVGCGVNLVAGRALVTLGSPSNMALQRTRRPSLRSGRSRCSLGSPLNAVALDGRQPGSG